MYLMRTVSNDVLASAARSSSLRTPSALCSSLQEFASLLCKLDSASSFTLRRCTEYEDLGVSTRILG